MSSQADQVTYPRSREALKLRWWFIAIPLFIMVILWQSRQGQHLRVDRQQNVPAGFKPCRAPCRNGSPYVGLPSLYAIFQFFWGFFIKKYGPRKTAMVTITMWSLSLLLSAVAHSAGQAITARILIGVAEAAMWPIANTFVANWFLNKERARANSIWINGTYLSQTVAGALVVALMLAGGWRMVFWILPGSSCCPCRS